MDNMLTNPTLTRHDFFYTDDALYEQTGVRIAFATRLGGESAAPYDSLNLGSHVGDDNATVIKNRQTFMAALTDKVIHLYNPTQVHGDNVVVIDDEHNVPATTEADGVVCRCKNVAPLLCFADCTPVILVSETGEFAVVHCGWRGVVNKIAVKALSMLEGDVNAYIGPHIGACCFEVGDEVAAQFDDLAVSYPKGNCHSEQSGSACTKAGDDECEISKPHVDMSAQLVHDLGLSPERVCDLGICTQCNQDLFFSYRGSGGKCGRHGAIAFRE